MKKLLFLILLTPVINAEDINVGYNAENNLSGYLCGLSAKSLINKGMGNCKEGDIIDKSTSDYDDFIAVCKYETIIYHPQNSIWDTCILRDRKDFVIKRERYKFPKQKKKKD